MKCWLVILFVLGTLTMSNLACNRVGDMMGIAERIENLQATTTPVR